MNKIEAHLWLDGPTSPEGRLGSIIRQLFLQMNAIALRKCNFTQEIKPISAYGHLTELTLPVLILWGDLDFPHVQERSRYLASIIPGAIGQEISGAAHLASLEDPCKVNQLLHDFLV